MKTFPGGVYFEKRARYSAGEKTDLFTSMRFPFEIHAGQYINRYAETYTTGTNSPDWKHFHTVYHTPKGDLHLVDRISRDPGPQSNTSKT